MIKVIQLRNGEAIMFDRTFRQLLSVVLSVSLVSSQSMGAWDVGILRAAKHATDKTPPRPTLPNVRTLPRRFQESPTAQSPKTAWRPPRFWSTMRKPPEAH